VKLEGDLPKGIFPTKTDFDGSFTDILSRFRGESATSRGDRVGDQKI
jgi:hypothetical protein